MSAIPPLRWNTRALADALDDDNVEARITAVNNVWQAAPLEVALPVLGRALADSDRRVSQHATGVIISRGLKLLAAEAKRLESALTVNPNDLAARSLLVGYYFLKGAPQLDSARSSRERHVLWIITHAPRSHIAGMHPAFVPSTQSEAYTQAKELWAMHVEANPQDTAILWNAAVFSMGTDLDWCEQLLRRGQELEPRDPKWSEGLGRVYRYRMKEGAQESRLGAARMALAHFETSVGLIRNEYERLRLLAVCASIALDCGDLKKSKEYASQALMNASQSEFHDFAGDTVHEANLILGRLALRSGNLDAATKYLIDAAMSARSPHLKSAGPNMVLAKELLEHGERRAVIEYLKLCSEFWMSIDHEAERWIQTLEEGGVPDFGTNLR